MKIPVLKRQISDTYSIYTPDGFSSQICLSTRGYREWQKSSGMSPQELPELSGLSLLKADHVWKDPHFPILGWTFTSKVFLKRLGLSRHDLRGISWDMWILILDRKNSRSWFHCSTSNLGSKELNSSCFMFKILNTIKSSGKLTVCDIENGNWNS